MARQRSEAKLKVAPTPKSELEETLNHAKKRYGESFVRQGTEIHQPDRIPTGIFVMDYATLGGFSHNRASMIVGARTAGKAQKATAKVLTPDGWVMFKDLSVGDSVIGSGGTPITVTGVYPRGVIDSYKVSFTDKTELIVGKDHLWDVQSEKQAETTGNHSIKTTDELFHSRLRYKAHGGCKYRIPMVSPVEFGEVELPIEPYVLGVLLANGNLKNSPFISINDEDITRYANSLLVGTKATITERVYASSTCRQWHLRVLGLWGKLSRDKFIPEVYLRASIENRISLLNGLMDCEGSIVYLDNCKNKKNSGIEYHTYSSTLAFGVQELVQSLGGTASISKWYRKQDSGYEYSVAVVLPLHIPAFKACRRKSDAYESRKRRAPIRHISHIIPDVPHEMICISVDAEDCLYVTEDYIVTHNSMLSNKLIASTQKLYPDQIVVLLDIEGTFEPVFAEALGVDLESLTVIEADTGEMAVDLVDAVLSSEESSMVVVDSLAAMIPCKEAESSAEDLHVGLQSRLIGGMVRKVTNVLVRERRRNHLVTPVYLNQFRCIDKKTNIWSTRGSLCAGEIVAGDRIDTPEGYKEVHAVQDTGIVQGIELITKNSATLRMSYTHRHVILGASGGLQEVFAGDIREGDWAVLSADSDIPIDRSSLFPEYREVRFDNGRIAAYKVSQVIDIKHIDTMDVIDIEVDGGLFFANDMLTHNSKIGSFQKFGEPLSIPGGKALEYCTSLQLIMKNKENKGKAQTGIEMMTTNDHSYSLTKNKINNGPRSGEFVLVREDGVLPNLGKGDIDNSPTILTYAKRFGLYTRSGTKYTLAFDEVKLIFGNQDQCISALREDRDLQWQLRCHLIAMEALRQRMPKEFCNRILQTPNVT